MGTASAILGQETQVTIRGKTWTLTRSTKQIQAAWGKWLADREGEAAMSTAALYRKQAAALRKEERELVKRYEDVDPADITAEENAAATEKRNDLAREASILEYEARYVVERYQDRRAAGEFDFHGNVGITLGQQNLPGRFMLVWLCLQPRHPKVTMEEVVEAHNTPADQKGPTNIDLWYDALMVSEGVKAKNDGAEAAPTPGSTPTPTTTDPAVPA